MEKKFNKSDCISQYAGLRGISKKEATEQFMTAMDVLTNAILYHNGATIPGYFSFVVVTRPPRKGMNPYKGEPIEIPEKKYVKLKLSSDLSRSLQDK